MCARFKKHPTMMRYDFAKNEALLKGCSSRGPKTADLWSKALHSDDRGDVGLAAGRKRWEWLAGTCPTPTKQPERRGKETRKMTRPCAIIVIRQCVVYAWNKINLTLKNTQHTNTSKESMGAYIHVWTYMYTSQPCCLVCCMKFCKFNLTEVCSQKVAISVQDKVVLYCGTA